MRGSFPAERQGAYLDTNVHHSAEDPNRPCATQHVHTLKTQRGMRASPPVSSTHTSHEESPQAPVAAAIAHKLKHAGAQPTGDTPADPPQKAMRLAHALPHHPHRLRATPSQKASSIFATLDKESERRDAIGLGLRLLTPWTS